MRTATVGCLAAALLSLSACSVLPSGSSAPEPAPEPPASAPAGTSDPAATSGATPSAPGSTDPSTGTGSSSPAAPPSSSASRVPATPGPAAGPGEPGEVVTTRTASFDGSQVEVQVHPVLRQGTVSHIDLTVSSDASEQDRVQLRGLFADDDNKAGDAGPWVADGLQLVDGKNAKLYLVASDGNGKCLCSRGLSTVFVHQGASVIISATFAAPPADVTAVDVRIPSFGTVRGVPVQ